MDRYGWKWTEKGTAPFLKAKDYKKLEVGVYKQENADSEIDLYSTQDFDGDSEDGRSEDECLEAEDFETEN